MRRPRARHDVITVVPWVDGRPVAVPRLTRVDAVIGPYTRPRPTVRGFDPAAMRSVLRDPQIRATVDHLPRVPHPRLEPDVGDAAAPGWVLSSSAAKGHVLRLCPGR